MAQAGRDETRIGDAERERAAEDLRTHTLAGRLSMDEYGERLAAVYDARTFADLRPIMHDLPQLDTAGVAARGSERSGGPFVGGPARGGDPVPAGHRQPDLRRGCGHRHRGRARGVPGAAWMVWIVVAIALTNISGAFWPVWVLGPMVLASLARRRWSWRPAERR